MKKEFKGLLRSEITKCERYASKVTGTDCEATGYSVKAVTTSEFIKSSEFVECDVETCRKDNGMFACRIRLVIPMLDRRRSYIASAE